jgi:hypothetical protein
MNLFRGVGGLRGITSNSAHTSGIHPIAAAALRSWEALPRGVITAALALSPMMGEDKVQGKVKIYVR